MGFIIINTKNIYNIFMYILSFILRNTTSKPNKDKIKVVILQHQICNLTEKINIENKMKKIN